MNIAEMTEQAKTKVKEFDAKKAYADTKTYWDGQIIEAKFFVVSFGLLLLAMIFFPA